MPDKLHLIVCESLVEEARSAAAEEAFSDVEIVPFAARCGQAASGSARLKALLESFRQKNIRAFVLGGMCMTGLSAEDGDYRRMRIDENQCFPLFLGQAAVEGMIQSGAYLITSGWVRHWKSTVKNWGFDRPQARSFFGESMKRIILLDTGKNPRAEDEGKEFAAFVGLPLAVQPVSLDLFRVYLRNAVLEWRLENERRRTADLAMLADLSAGLTRVASEAETVDNIFLLFRSLFAPKRILFLSLRGGVPGETFTEPRGAPIDPEDVSRLRGMTGESEILEAGDGFRLRIVHGGETLALTEIRGFAFPVHRDHYLNLALTLSRIAGLAISNARSYQLLQEERDRTQAYLHLSEKAVAERELLLKEVNHRVKNNFQMLAAMLRLQSANLSDPKALAICREMQSRIKSIAFVHERLYKSADLAAVDFQAYIGQIIRELAETFRAEAARIRIETEIDAPGLNIDTSIPLGLIINELIANAFKHAFPGDRAGTIRIRLRLLPEERFELIVKDDGVGFPPGLDIGKTESLGLQLVQMMSEQLDGTVELDGEGGAGFRIVFRERSARK